MSNDFIDTPVSLTYNNGSSFPANAKIIGYALLGVGFLLLISMNVIIGPTFLLIGLFICFTTYGVEFNPEKKEVIEFTNYLGIIPVKKRFSYEKWGFISVVPLRITATVYGRSSNSTSITDNYFTICLLGKNYRSKKELIRFDNKNTAETTAKSLSHRLGLEYFEYDPLVIRNAYRK